MSNTTTSSDQFWGDLRSLIHASHIDFETLAQLTAEFLEHASEETRARVQRYIEDNFKRRRTRDEVTQEFSAHIAPSCFGQESGRTAEFLDEGLMLTTSCVDEEDEWADEYERYEYEEEREWADYDIIDIHQGATPARLIADLEVMGGVQFITQRDEDGEVLHVTCLVPEEFNAEVYWYDTEKEEWLTHSVHIDLHRDIEELCFD